MSVPIRTAVVHALEDVWPVALRPEDAAELEAAGSTPEAAIAFSIHQSCYSFAVYLNGNLACVWGYRRTGFAADVWLLTTEEVNRHPFAFIKESRRLLHILQEEFSEIRCEVHADYTKTKMWLARLGFTNSGDGLQEGFIKFSIGGVRGPTG